MIFQKKLKLFPLRMETFIGIEMINKMTNQEVPPKMVFIYKISM